MSIEAVTHTPAPAAEAKPDDKVSGKLSILVQREKRALELERRAKDGMTAFEKREADLSAREAKMKEFEGLKETNPMKALELLNLSYSDLSNVALNDGNVPADLQIKQLREEISRERAAREDEKRQAAEMDKKRAEDTEVQTLQAFKEQIKREVDADKSYELVSFEQAYDDVFKEIDDHFNATFAETGTGVVLEKKEAAARVQKKLEEGKYAKATEIEFFKSKFAPSKPSFMMAKQQQATNNQPPKTLTNNLSATPAKPQTRVMNDEDRKARAIAYFNSLRR